MCRFLEWKLVATNGRAEGRSLPMGIVTIGPAFQHERLPPEAGMLLPSADTNLVLLSLLEARPERFAGLAAGLFLSDPFLNVDLAIKRLQAAGVTWIAALPSACQHEPDFRRYLREVDLDLERELRVLKVLEETGLSTISTVASAEDAAVVASVATAVLVLPNTAEFADGFPDLAIRLELEEAAHQTDAPAPLRLGLRSPHEERWVGRLDGAVLRPTPFAA